MSFYCSQKIIIRPMIKKMQFHCTFLPTPSTFAFGSWTTLCFRTISLFFCLWLMSYFMLVFKYTFFTIWNCSPQSAKWYPECCGQARGSVSCDAWPVCCIRYNWSCYVIAIPSKQLWYIWQASPVDKILFRESGVSSLNWRCSIWYA